MASDDGEGFNPMNMAERPTKHDHYCDRYGDPDCTCALQERQHIFDLERQLSAAQSELAEARAGGELLGAQAVLQSLQNFESVEHDAQSILRECAGALESKGFNAYPGALRFIADRIGEQWKRVGQAVAELPAPPPARGESDG